MTAIKAARTLIREAVRALGSGPAQAAGSGPRIRRDIVEAWVDEGRLRPQRSARGLVFSEMDLARAELIQDLRELPGHQRGGAAIILDLVDQMCGLRRMLRELCEAIGAQPKPKLAVETLSRRPIPSRRTEDQ